MFLPANHGRDLPVGEINMLANQSKRAFAAVRTLIFYAAAIPITMIFGLIAVVLLPITSLKFRYNFLKNWAKIIIYGLRLVCGVRWRITGHGNVPTQPCVLLSRHESTWETLAYHILFPRNSMVAKKKLTKVPGFGIIMRQINPILIEQNRSMKEFLAIKTEGLARLTAGMHVVVFPEGTRRLRGDYRGYYHAGPWLAKASGGKVVFINIDSGKCWNKKSLIINPGQIEITVSPAQSTVELSAREIGQRFAGWINLKNK